MEKKKTSPVEQNRMQGRLHRSFCHDNIITLAAALLHDQPFQSKTAKEECLHSGIKLQIRYTQQGVGCNLEYFH